MSDELSLHGISKALADENNMTITAMLILLIDDLSNFLNVGKTMTANQTAETVRLIIKTYNYFKPGDFKNCFDKIKSGAYGKLYDRFDGQIIMVCLSVYDDERANDIEGFRASENSDLKRLSASLLDNAENSDEVFTRNMAKLKQTLEESKNRREAAKIIREREKAHDPVRELHQKWIREFDAIWKKQGYPKNRLIKRFGMVKNPFFKMFKHKPEPQLIARTIDINTFLEHKQWQFMLSQMPYEHRMEYYLLKYPDYEK